MTLGSYKSQTHALTTLAREHNCVVVSVEYRLSPETIYPGAKNDCHAALQWLHANAAALGVDPQLLVLMGESAGAGILTQLSFELRDKGTVPVQAQILAYPMLDDRTASTHQPPSQMGTFIWPREANPPTRARFQQLPPVPVASQRGHSNACARHWVDCN